MISTGTAAAAVTSGTEAHAVDVSLVGNALSLTGNAGDALYSPESWGAITGSSGGYYTYTLGSVFIRVDEDVLAFT